MQIPKALHSALLLFGCWEAFQRLLQTATSFEAVKAGVEALKADAERAYKQQALKAHPDHGGCEERMKALNAARDVLRKLEVRRPPPRPVVTVIHMHTDSWGSGTTTATSYGFPSTGGTVF